MFDPITTSAMISVGGSLAGGLMGSSSAKKAAQQQADAIDRATRTQDIQAATARNDNAPYREAGSSAVNRLKLLLGMPGAIDDNDPRFKEIQDDVIARADAEHQQKFGMSIFDGRSYLSAPGERARFDELVRNQAKQQFAAQHGEPSQTDPEAGALNEKFTVADFYADPVTKLGMEFGLKQGTTVLDRMAGARGMRNSGATLKALTQFGDDYAGTKAAESSNRFYGDQDRTFNRLAGIAGVGQTATANTTAAGANAANNSSNLMASLGNARGAASIASGNAWGNAFNTIGNWWQQQNALDRIFPKTKTTVPQVQTTPYAFNYAGTGMDA